jgi:Bacterial Alpha-2-macroglobulin MG10 domain/MG2 domain/Alpha-2-macroglobulin family
MGTCILAGNHKEHPMDKISFRSLLLLILCSLFFMHTASAQNGPPSYDQSWKTVDSLAQKKGLTKSALAVVQEIYRRARREKNEAQIIKSLLVMTELKGPPEEGLGELLNTFKTDTVSFSPAATAILYSLQASALLNYLQQHRWQFYSRTAVNGDSSTDFKTWPIDRFNQRIGELFLLSLRPADILQKTALEPFDPIILKGNVRYLRPSLYDLLAHRALDYLGSDESDVPRPAYAFRFTDPAMLGDRETFVHTAYRTADTGSFHYKALLLYQELIRFHERDDRPDALVDVDIQRIEMIYHYAAMPAKEDLRLQALKRISGQYPALPAAAIAWYLQARIYSDKATAYDPLGDTSNRYGFLQAKKICEAVMIRPDSSAGSVLCRDLFNNIVSTALKTEVENVNLPDMPFRALITYKNIQKIYGRILRMDDVSLEDLQNRDGENTYWKRLLRMKSVRQLEQAIPDAKDYREHRVEIKIDALPSGQYALLTSSDHDFGDRSILTVQFFSISGIAFVNNGNDYFVVDRDSGHPLKGVKVDCGYEFYDSKARKTTYSDWNHYTSNENGYFRATESETTRYRQQKFIFTLHDDRLVVNAAGRGYDEVREDDVAKTAEAYERGATTVFFFTDRSIYRPGQTVYFKGLPVTKDFSTRQYKIISDYHARIGLYNANGVRIDSLSLQSNDFGSFHGSFVLPSNQLNGEYRIEDSVSSGNQSFSVEEYKRPKFHVDYDKLTGSYHLGDSVRITGSAKSYAGNSISGAMVNYRVVRSTRIPYPWFYPRLPSSGEMEMTRGTALTDASGSFRIRFAALPDLSVNRESGPIFEYRITADITDINGESRSATTSVAAGYEPFTLSIGVPDNARIPADSLHLITIQSNNLNGEFVPVRVRVLFSRLQAPGRLIRPRYWPAPDQFVMDEETYLRDFPNDEYNRETEKQNWKITETPIDRTDSTTASGDFFAGRKYNPEPGWYLVESMAGDESGNKVIDKKYIEILGKKSSGDLNYNPATEEDQTAEPGQSLTIQTGSSADDLFVIRRRNTVAPDGGPAAYSFFSLDREIKTTPLTISEADRGGFALYDVFVKNNRFFSVSHEVHVPWTNKDLNISYETYRDKTLPGSREQWKVKISGNRRDQMTAEVLTSMYDASLDQFKPQAWGLPGLYPVYGGTNGWAGLVNFGSGSSIARYLPEINGHRYWLNYDQLTAGLSDEIDFDKQLNETVVIGYSTIRRGAPGAVQNVQIRGLATNVPSKAEMAKFTRPKIEYDRAGETGLADSAMIGLSGTGIQDASVQIRKNFNETAFFFPELKTDTEGNLSFSFDMPEALTTWKWMLLAHTRALDFGYSQKNIITRKELMLQPDMPRFLRAGDTVLLPVKIANLSGDSLTGGVELQWLDPSDKSSQDQSFQNIHNHQTFTVAAGGSALVRFPVVVPSGSVKPVLYRLIARTEGGARSLSDGEEATLPVLTNRMLVTESLPLYNAGIQEKSYTFDKLLHSGESKTLVNQGLTVEYASNPAWYAVQSLPYLMEFPYECAEQTFNRFYSDAVASMIVTRSPLIKSVFGQWKASDTAALPSNLQKNEELKSALLRETPWVMEAASENEQKKHIAFLFDKEALHRQLQSALTRLPQMQSENGGFSWFKGGPDDQYITQYILSGIGHLKKLEALPGEFLAGIREICRTAIPYTDRQIRYDYDHLNRKRNPDLLTASEIQYLYMRSFFAEYAPAENSSVAIRYFRTQASRLWPRQNMFLRGMIALYLNRTGDPKTAREILASLKENATVSEDRGMFWAAVSGGYYWQQSPIETQALLIEVFDEIDPDRKAADQMKRWLLQQKQVQQWGTTRATADACYALLLKGSDWLAGNPVVRIQTGDTIVSSESEKTEAGTGYFKHRISGNRVEPAMGHVRVSVSAASEKAAPGWGAVYWQYFEELDKITPAKTPLSVSKSLFIEKNEDRGPVLEPLTENREIHPGDKITVRLLIKSDRDMEYLHLKDMRAACFEPVSVLSGYQWRDGLGYYQTTHDESTSFFFDHLPAGTYMIEYSLFTTAPGHFSNGISTIGCMYAPAFSAHTEGIRINVTDHK